VSSERTLEGYIHAVASAAPAPGGGSVVGVVGALSAALGQMVLNFTDAPDGEGATHRDDLVTALRACQSRLMQAAEQDEVAYQGYRDAAVLPRGTAEEKAARKLAMQAALIASTDVPLAMAEQAVRLAVLLIEVAEIGNRRLASDAALSALLAEATLRGALLNVRGNAALLKDVEKAQHYREAADRLESEGRRAAVTALEVIGAL
jgi:glutamate formiminotransferase/formiminotetrahydrofolate cyclodeaminase